MTYRPIIVTRHPALVTYLREIGLAQPDTEVVEHVTPEQIRGRVVIGVLPLSQEAYSVIEVPLDIPAQLRGKELTIEQVREYAGSPVSLRVERSDFVLDQVRSLAEHARVTASLGISTDATDQDTARTAAERALPPGYRLLAHWEEWGDNEHGRGESATSELIERLRALPALPFEITAERDITLRYGGALRVRLAYRCIRFVATVVEVSE